MRRFQSAVRLLTVVYLVFALAVAAAAEQGPHQLRIVWRDAPATSAVISWSTTEPGESHTVHYDTQPHNGKIAEYPNKVTEHASGPYSRDGDAEDAKKFYHHVTLTGLKPSTTYHFIAATDGRPSRELSFVTAPADDRPFSILFGGDSRSDHDARQQVNEMIAELVEADPSIIALAHGGDFIVNGAVWEQWDAWLTQHEQTFTKDGRVLPIIPTRGNHDRGDLFNQVFAFPGEGGDKNYYVTQLGEKAALVTLNTETSTAGDQKKWLAGQLESLRPKNRWLLAQYHKPAFPAVKRPSSALRDFVPLFEEHNVDLACEADGHNIKRTPPIRDGKADPSGVVYIGEGGLGVRQRKPDTDRWYLQKPGVAGAAHHVMKLNLKPEALEYQTILLEERKVFDSYTLKPRNN